MKKLFLGIFLAILVLVIASPAAASMLIPANDGAKENGKAPEKAPVMGDNWDLERIDFIHYAKPEHPAKPPREPAAPKCYRLLGLKWKSLPVDYVINPTNPQALPEEFVKSAISSSAETWDGVTSAELFNDTYKVDYEATYGKQNFVNAVSFGDYPDDRVIGVTTIWYTPRGRQIVEFDVLLNTRFNWGDAKLDNSLMDVVNIATHEFGHGVGLDDVYETACSEVTMYGYSDYGETNKRVLAQPDITGLQTMYGK